MVLGSGIPESLKENLSLRLNIIFFDTRNGGRKMPSLVFLTNELINPLEIEITGKLLSYLSVTQKAELVPYSESCGISARLFLEKWIIILNSI